MYEGAPIGPTRLGDALDLQVSTLDAVSCLLTRARGLMLLAEEKQFWSGRTHAAYLESVLSVAHEIAEASYRVDDAIALTRRAALTFGAASSLMNGTTAGGNDVK